MTCARCLRQGADVTIHEGAICQRCAAIPFVLDRLRMGVKEFTREPVQMEMTLD